MNWIYYLLIFLMILLFVEELSGVIGLTLIVIGAIFSSIRVTKTEIAEYYGITKKTLNKWVRYVPSNLDRERYKKARILSYYNFIEILNVFGYVEDQKPLYKNMIKAVCESNYRTIRENITEKYCGISQAIYTKMDVFPPIISGKIISHIGN